jgi:hypothetical protein
MQFRLADELPGDRIVIVSSEERLGAPHLLLIHSGNDAIIGKIYKKASAWEFECGETAFDPEGSPYFHSIYEEHDDKFAALVLGSLRQGLARYERDFLHNPPENR